MIEIHCKDFNYLGDYIPVCYILSELKFITKKLRMHAIHNDYLQILFADNVGQVRLVNFYEHDDPENCFIYINDKKFDPKFIVNNEEKIKVILENELTKELLEKL